MRRLVRARRRLTPFERVETERLVLRRPVSRDLADFHRVHADARTWTHAPALRHETLEQSERQLGVWLAHWRQRGFGYWSVEHDGAIAGFGGLMTLHAWQGRDDVLNLYYRFQPESWGRGLATELCRAAIDLAARELPDDLVVARIRPSNAESQRVAERAGLERRPDLDDGEFLVYATMCA